jgi:putative endonuclease
LAEARRLQGEFSERQAETLLRRLGYTILERNARTRWGELDIVARDGDEIVFVEVKSRRTGSATPAIASVTPSKVSRLVRLGQAYIQELGGSEPPWRIDVITVVLGPDGAVRGLEHYRHAVER